MSSSTTEMKMCECGQTDNLYGIRKFVCFNCLEENHNHANLNELIHSFNNLQKSFDEMKTFLNQKFDEMQAVLNKPLPQTTDLQAIKERYNFAKTMGPLCLE